MKTLSLAMLQGMAWCLRAQEWLHCSFSDSRNGDLERIDWANDSAPSLWPSWVALHNLPLDRQILLHVTIRTAAVNYRDMRWWYLFLERKEMKGSILVRQEIRGRVFSSNLLNCLSQSVCLCFKLPEGPFAHHCLGNNATKYWICMTFYCQPLIDISCWRLIQRSDWFSIGDLFWTISYFACYLCRWM